MTHISRSPRVLPVGSLDLPGTTTAFSHRDIPPRTTSWRRIFSRWITVSFGSRRCRWGSSPPPLSTTPTRIDYRTRFSSFCAMAQVCAFYVARTTVRFPETYLSLSLWSRETPYCLDDSAPRGADDGIRSVRAREPLNQKVCSFSKNFWTFVRSVRTKNKIYFLSL